MVSFCPNCWREIDAGRPICPECGADLTVEDARPFVEKVRRALFHPEPETAVRAAWILGERREKAAVPELIRTLETARDRYLAEAAAESLGKIGDASALPALERAAESGSLRMRLAARAAVERISEGRDGSVSMRPNKAGSVGTAGAWGGRRPAATEAFSLERSLPFAWNAFETALEREGCPICHVLGRWEERSLFTFLYEGMMNAHVRQKFLDGGGFCARHFWAVTHLGINFWSVGTLEVAHLCVPLVARAEKGIEQGTGNAEKALPWSRKGRRERIPPGAACIFCRELAAEEQSLIRTLEQFVAEEAFARRLAARGLCLPHLERAIAAWKQAARRAWLMEAARERIAELAHDLREFVRKHEHPYRDEPIGREVNVVSRAMEFLVGFESRPPRGKGGREKRQ